MKTNKKLKAIILLIILVLPIISAIPIFNKTCDNFIVIDSDKTTNLPDNYRDISFLNISGSAQFTPDQIPNLKKSINKNNITIIDLRQESHGFVNDIAISFYSPYITLNDGLNTEKVENKELSQIKTNSQLSLYDKFCKEIKKLTVNSVSNEQADVTKNNMKYIRYAVRDGGTPTPIVVDSFVEFIKNKPTDEHVHFHCDAGDGRTTQFMIMYQIMFNDKGASLQEIENFQTNLGTVKFKFDKNRQEFLQKFYDYVNENKSNNYSTSYSQWIKAIDTKK